ncbi:MAG: hypothetical protein C4290_11470 [Chloroflexota bacterium]
MYEATRDKARTIIADQLQKIQRLRATGPNPFDYWIWADETVQALEAIYGRASAETQGLAAILYARGRTRDQRGALDNMTLGLHGEWGIRARLNRAEPYLNRLLEQLARGTVGVG